MLRNLPKFGLVTVGLAFLAGCSPADQTADTETTDQAQETTQPPPAMDPAAYTVDFTASPQDSMVSGSVQVDPNPDNTGIRVSLTGLTPGEHAWHIHQGTCEAGGDVVVALTDTGTMTGIASPLAVGDNGEVTTTVTIPTADLSPDMIQSGAYSLHVHERGGTEHGPTVACADLGR